MINNNDSHHSSRRSVIKTTDISDMSVFSEESYDMEETTQKATEEKDKARSGVSEGEKISEDAAVLHLVKGNIGIGVLAIPSALVNSGLAVGTLGLALIALTTVHCMNLLGIRQRQQLLNI